MSKKIYVGNLPYTVRDAQLGELFAQYGVVESAKVMMERDNPRRSRGFGFVEMPDADADAAVAGLANADFEGRRLVVNEARPMEERPPRAPRSNDSYGNNNSYGGGDRY